MVALNMVVPKLSFVVWWDIIHLSTKNIFSRFIISGMFFSCLLGMSVAQLLIIIATYLYNLSSNPRLAMSDRYLSRCLVTIGTRSTQLVTFRISHLDLSHLFISCIQVHAHQLYEYKNKKRHSILMCLDEATKKHSSLPPPQDIRSQRNIHHIRIVIHIHM